ncbi:MAG: murein DD-endopeptidase MepM/ murein hydrolase activator NlpD [Polaribacter sp.]|jgi:murein DD-endopeptidase MepM/ murein hydrolase activator NlpD
MNQIPSVLFLAFLILLSGCKNDDVVVNDSEQTIYEINENGIQQDFLTPNYYNINETDLRNEINKFIHFVRLEDYQNPFQNATGAVASYSTNRAFGNGIGLGGTSQHHSAIDLHPANPTNITIYAVHDGMVNTYRDSPIYRHYLTITKEIKDSENNLIGKLVSLYAHIDLGLDENESIQLNGLSVNKGDLVSKNLYSETMGGPHLHFEIRFYRNSEIGNEDFYNWQNSGNYTTQSSGIWSYGYWNPDVGYGFGNPLNFGIE